MATDFQAIVDGMAAMTCVVSVEQLEDGSCGAFRIVTGNKPYIDSIEHPAPGTQMLSSTFVPNSLYTDYLTRDLNFEDYCYRAAVMKKCLHSYAHPDRMNVWFNMTFLPLAADDGNLSYCTYTMEIDFKPDSARLANVSNDLASDVLGIAILLRSSNDFASAMMSTAERMRTMCRAEYCGILRVDDQTRSCAVLGESIAHGSSLRPMDSYLDDGFYDIARSWRDTISGSNCIIAKNDQDMAVIEERNPAWHASLMTASIDSIALFPLKSHDILLGYIWVVNFDAQDTTDIKETLELTTHILATEIANHLMIKQLKKLGTRDMLTGAMNRNEMDIRLTRIAEGQEGAGSSVGVVFADLNGLKAMNDACGHAAGDKLLVDGAKALGEAFPPDRIYRAGGDEFVIIETGMTQQDLDGKIEALKLAEKRYENVSFAIGGCIEPDAKNVRKALKAADALMYKDKDTYYNRS